MSPLTLWGTRIGDIRARTGATPEACTGGRPVGDGGAGLSILRLGIGSSADHVYDHMFSIEPTDPGGPTATPRYQWDGNDGGQVWLAHQAQVYGVDRFYADAWSAPGYMKTNGTDANGGTLCGLQDAACASGDWRAAYANYLVQYTRFYAQEGIRITDPVWVSEWGPSGSVWDARWDDASGQDGLTVASHIQTALTAGNVSAYLFWLGASLGATKAFIQLNDDSDGYQVSKRLWAMAAFSRFIRPDAVRLDATTDLPGLSVSAFRNVDGSEVIEVLNTGTTAVSARLAARPGRVQTYLTDETHDLVKVASGPCVGTTSFAARSLTTLVIGGR